MPRHSDPSDPSNAATVPAFAACANCNKVFEQVRPSQLHCSKRCKNEAEEARQAALRERRCDWCGKRLQTTNPKARYCNNSCRAFAFKARPCLYCGDIATQRDHFIPVTFVKRIQDFARSKKAKIVVPCCAECNRTANNEVFSTIREKRQYIKDRYLIKYRKLLDSPVWDPEEIEELGSTLQTHILRDQEVKRNLKARLARLSR